MNSETMNNSTNVKIQKVDPSRCTDTISSANLFAAVNTESSKIENIIPFSLFKKINELYSSIVDAGKVLSKYKENLLTVVSDNNCLTPLTDSKKIPMLFYKREDLTSIGAYKVRGALYQMKKVLEENSQNSDELKFIAASTGNHALGVLKAAEILKVPDVTICISESVTEFKRLKLEKRVSELRETGINAKLLVAGKTFDETNKIACEMVKKDKNSFYTDPYNTHNAVAGQGTIGLELLSQLENKSLDFNVLKELTVVVPIGGGGLISGISCALKSKMNNSSKFEDVQLRVIGVKLDDLNSKYGDAIKVIATGDHNDKYIEYFVESKELINDTDMLKGINFVYEDLGVKIEGASAGTLKPVLENIITPSETNAVVCIISGGNS